jgi:putative endonuclease
MNLQRQNQRLLFTLNSVYIGIDLAWGEKNLSGFCVLEQGKNKLKILDIKLIKSIDDILNEIQKYKNNKVYIGVDAPLVIPNETGNREIEKKFNKDFAKYKISMLPVNIKLLTKYSPNIRSEELFSKLTNLNFQRDYKATKVIFEVYTHSTIAICFNNYKILPYKRKKGRNTVFIKQQLSIYKKYLQKVLYKHKILDFNIELLRGQSLKDYEDKLDSITCAYTMYYAKNNESKFYQVNGVDTFLTPISPWKVYILKCSDNSLYTGITIDLKRRVLEHNTSNKGARYTKIRRPVSLVYWENCDNKVHAMQKEYSIKKLTRKNKLELIVKFNNSLKN